MKKYLSALSNYFLKIRPFELTIFVTARCNFRCPYCLYWKNLNEKEQLSLQEFKKFAQSMPSVERLIFTGGEPFLRKDLGEIIEEFYKSSTPKYITIPTNGFYTDKIVATMENILAAIPRAFVNVSLSLDELGDRRDSITGVEGGFKNLIQTASKLKKIQNRFKNLGITVICTQTASNENRLDEIYQFAKEELGLDNFGFSVVRGNPYDKNTLKIDAEKYHRMCDKLLDSYKGKCVNSSKIPFYRVYLTNRELVYKNTYKTLLEKSFQIKCYAGILRGVVRENGEVYPCEELMDNEREQFLIGRLQDYDMDFQKLWYSKRRKEIVGRIKQMRCYCPHGCDMTVNTLFSEQLPVQILKKLFSHN